MPTHDTPFAALVSSVRDYAIFLLDATGHVVTWNAGAEAAKGYRAEEIVGRHFSSFYTPEDRAAGLPGRLLSIAAREGRVESLGWRVRKDGTRFWADVVITAVRTPDGALDGFVKVTRDLSEQRAAEEELRQSEERLRLLIASVRDYAIFLLDPEGRIQSWNPGAELIKGYRADEVVGRHIELFYTPQARAEGRPRRLLGIAASDGRVEDEGWRVRKDGTRFWADVVISRIIDEQGRLAGFTKVTRDLTDRRRAEEALAARAREQALAAELGLAALREPDVDGVIAAATAAIRDTLGVDRVDVTSAAPGDGETIAVPIHDDGVGRFALVVRHPGRALTTSDVSFLQTIANVIAAAVARQRMDQQRRESEAAAAAARERAGDAERRVRERDDFIQVAAHELRTPLAALRLKLDGVLQLLRRAAAPTPAQLGERIEGAARHTTRMATLVDRLLDVSRIVSGRLQLDVAEVDLGRLVADLADGFREQATAAGCDLQVTIRGDTRGRGDRARLEQVFTNLLANALKYGHGRPVEIAVDGDDRRVRVTVTDHGIGIAPEDAERIFERFERAAAVSHYGGLGLGLYVTRHLVVAHGGTIAVESAPGAGARFTVELPR